MAGVSSDRLTTCVADVATHVSPMSRLMTMARPTGVGRADAINIRIPIERADYNVTALGA
jgi:hypothetical protein